MSVRKRSDSKRVLSARKRSGSGDSTEVGHSVIATGRGVLRLSSSISTDVCTPAEK
ncbi:hypothetical protein [Lysinibacillus sp. CTST325]